MSTHASDGLSDIRLYWLVLFFVKELCISGCFSGEMCLCFLFQYCLGYRIIVWFIYVFNNS